MSKCHIVGNHVSRFIIIYIIIYMKRHSLYDVSHSECSIVRDRVWVFEAFHTITLVLLIMYMSTSENRIDPCRSKLNRIYSVSQSASETTEINSFLQFNLIA